MIFHRDQVTPFVVIFYGRCGSTYLMESLDTHPDIHIRMEYLCTLKERKKGAKEQLQWVSEFLSPPFDHPCAAIGFKTKLRDVLDPEGFARVLQDWSVSIVHLRRRNSVKSTVSLFNSVRLKESTGDWNLYDKQQRLAATKLDVAQFDAWLRRLEQRVGEEADYVDNLQLPTLTLYYEDLLMDEAATFGQIFSFLGLTSRPMQGRTIKATSDDLRDAVANFDELRSHYQGTRYEAMFDEVLMAG